MVNDVILKLKEPLLNTKNEPFKDYNALDLTPQQLQQSSGPQLRAIAPDSKIGDLLSGMLMTNIKPRDGNEAVKLQRWAIKINQAMVLENDNGDLHLDQMQLKELIDIFTKNPINVENASVLGGIIYYLQEKETELNEKIKSSTNSL